MSDFAHEPLGELPIFVLVIVLADVRRDRETGGYRDTQPAHLCQVRAFPAEKVTQTLVAIRTSTTKIIDTLRHRAAKVSKYLGYLKFESEASSQKRPPGRSLASTDAERIRTMFSPP